MTKNNIRLRDNLILNCDSYKLSHMPLYPKNATGMHSYIEARKPNETIVPFGLQMWIKKNLLTPITKEDITEYVDFATRHGEPVFPDVFQYIIDEYKGFLPITIWGVPEGIPTPSQTSLVALECLDEKLKFLPSFLETNLQRGVWYPYSVASNDRKNWLALKEFYEKGADTNGLLPFALHDFAGRGVSSEETAQIGSAAHLVHFMGSDTISGVRAANHYYNCEMAAYSVRATEHSIQCAYGPDNQKEYLETIIREYGQKDNIISIVLDGYDVYRESELLSQILVENYNTSNNVRRDNLPDLNFKVVYRPDSGNPLEVIPKILAIQEKYFGYTLNSKGFKVINHVGIIQGDGINHETMKEIAKLVMSLGYSPECVIFGSGGALLQAVMRDDYSFAQKASAILMDGVWHDIYKAPITDAGKRSKAGRQVTPEMVKFYDGVGNPGELLVDDTLSVIRSRAQK